VVLTAHGSRRDVHQTIGVIRPSSGLDSTVRELHDLSALPSFSWPWSADIVHQLHGSRPMRLGCGSPVHSLHARTGTRAKPSSPGQHD
jgi:hypothetical protein